MVNLYKEFRKSLHPESKIQGSNEILGFLIDPDTSKEQKNEMAKIMIDCMRENGAKLMNRALEEKFISNKEWNCWQSKGLDVSDMQPILLNHYAVKDGHVTKDERCIVVTVPKSPLHKNKDMLHKRFKGMKIKTLVEVNKEFKKEEDKKKK